MKKFILFFIVFFPALLFSQEGISLRSLKFYPSPSLEDISVNSREYSFNFQKTVTCVINYEIVLSNLKFADQNLLVKAAFYDSKSKALQECVFEYDLKIDKDKEVIYSTGYCGYEEPGYWDAGVYRLEISVNGVLFTSGTFSVTY